jgi:sugar phosphate permease
MPTEPEKSNNESSTPKWLIIFCLIVAGETIFGLPFHIIRYFRPALLEVFQLNNTQVGDAIAVYGITAMACYFPSGVIADRFSARRLMFISLLSSALGGLWMATIPSQLGLALLYGFWGITNILLFWSAMLRATREWGGKLAQGRAFGLLDGGRGLVSAAAATIAVFFLSSFLPAEIENVTRSEKVLALKAVIWFYTALTFGAAILVWFFIPDTKQIKVRQKSNNFNEILKVLKSRSVWLQALIVVCAYCGYRGLDMYSLYAVDVLDMDDVSAARLMSNATYLRPVGAIVAGFIADRFTTTKTMVATFVLLIGSYLVLFFSFVNETSITLILTNLTITILAVYALRGIYFALFEETHVPKNLTGTTVGLVSLVGFTPDIFFHSIAGRILDANPGEKGFNMFFLLLIGFAVLGILATLVLNGKRNRFLKV